MNILVTGGAGYIGSITVQELIKKGHKVIVYDNLNKGYRESVKNVELIIGDIHDSKKLEKVFEKKNIDAVIHFVSFIEMGESYKKPYKYFYNNYVGSLQLFKAMIKCGIKKIVFSSSAGVYGIPKRLPIKEEDSKKPENPYGETKVMVENTLKWFYKAYGLRSISLRYFNAAGATLNGNLGEAHNPESHLIPNLIKTALGENEFYLFGDNYKTKDGTCVRDYIHVLDLASAHILALEYLDKNDVCTAYNVGTGKGYSNKELIRMVKKISSVDFKINLCPKRKGDANELFADSSKIKKELGWKPKFSDIKTIIKSAWEWHKKNYNICDY